MFSLKAVLIPFIPDGDVPPHSMVLCITLCRNWLTSSWETLRNTEIDSITALQEDRGVVPECWKEGRISLLCLDGFCFLIIQELLLLQLGDPDSGSTKSSPTNIFKRDVHKINVKGGKQHYCLLVEI